jgi:hypothetical protein
MALETIFGWPLVAISIIGFMITEVNWPAVKSLIKEVSKNA